MGTAIKHPVSFVVFDIQAHWRLGLSVSVPGSAGCQKLQITA